MAVIRCQACGKPNPDFLEICQYCEARLKPLTSELTPPPDAAPEAAEPAPAEPAGTPGIVNCQACGKPNPTFVDVCQYCEARLTPLTGTLTQPAEPHEPVEDGIRCQACGKLNPAYLEVCQYCEARLTPVAAEESELSGPEAPAEPAEPDWLSSLRSSSAEPPAAEPASDVPDWLRELQGRMSSAGAPAEEEPPAWLQPSGSAPEADTGPAEPAMPAWLRDLPAAGRAPADEPGPSAPSDDWLAAGAPEAASEPEAAAEPSDEVPDWLRALQRSSQAGPAEPEIPAEPGADWQAALRGLESPDEVSEDADTVEMASADMPDWLRAMQPQQPRAASAPEEEVETPAADLPAAEMPDWLRAMQPGGAEPVEPAGPLASNWAADLADEPAQPQAEEQPAEQMPDWLSSLRTAGPADEAPAKPEEAEEAMPDWLARAQTGQPAQPAEEAAPEVGETPGEDVPEWLRTLRGAQPEAEPAGSDDMPQWLRTLRGVPPSRGTGKTDFLRAIGSESTAESGEPGAPAAPEALEGEGLAQAALPSWLAAMRPVDIAPPAEGEEADDYEERIGVLAGMRGVLRAEPAVALPRKSTVQVNKLDVNAAHLAQAGLLTSLLGEEAQAHPVTRRQVRFAPLIERLVIIAIMLAAILIPAYVLPGIFPLPASISPETAAAFRVVEGIPAGTPVLVAFDYEPAHSGELNTAAQAMITHLLLRGAPVVAVSTRPAGAAVADRILEDVRLAISNTQGFQYTYGFHYLNLGYIPGGPTGLLQFATDPRSVFSADFGGAEQVWQQPAVSGVTRLNDFGALVLVTASPDTARAWIEQTQLFAAQAPTIAAVSAGADPLLRPYYESDSPQLQGLVSGIVGAVQYERQLGLPQTQESLSNLQARWDGLGGGLFAAALLLAGGNLVYGAYSLTRQRRRSA